MTVPSTEAIGPPDGETPRLAIADRPPADPELLAKLGRLKDFIDGLLASAGLPAPEPAAAEATDPLPAPEPEPIIAPQVISVTTFNVDVIFQTLYEFCTNESVKDHIKVMREAQNTAFNTQEVADALSELAQTLEEEDGAYNIPIPAILKALYAATSSEEFRGILKKMNQTAASIFLDNVLPIEGETREIEVPSATEPAPAASVPAPPSTEEAAVAPPDSPDPEGRFCSLGDLQALQALAAEIEQLAHSSTSGSAETPSPAPLEAGEHPAIYTSILTRDRDTIVNTVHLAHELIQQTGWHLTRILEALSFQDLSGPRGS